MLIKTDKITKTGRTIYRNVLTGQEGTTDQVKVAPSQRYFDRQGTRHQRVRSNRKRTKGRLIHHQEVPKTVVTTGGKLHKVSSIKHVQETPNALSRKIALLNFTERIEVLKAKWFKAHPEYKCSK